MQNQKSKTEHETNEYQSIHFQAEKVMFSPLQHHSSSTSITNNNTMTSTSSEPQTTTSLAQPAQHRLHLSPQSLNNNIHSNSHSIPLCPLLNTSHNNSSVKNYHQHQHHNDPSNHISLIPCPMTPTTQSNNSVMSSHERRRRVMTTGGALGSRKMKRRDTSDGHNHVNTCRKQLKFSSDPTEAPPSSSMTTEQQSHDNNNNTSLESNLINRHSTNNHNRYDSNCQTMATTTTTTATSLSQYKYTPYPPTFTSHNQSIPPSPLLPTAAHSPTKTSVMMIDNRTKSNNNNNKLNRTPPMTCPSRLMVKHSGDDDDNVSSSVRRRTQRSSKSRVRRLNTSNGGVAMVGDRFIPERNLSFSSFNEQDYSQYSYSASSSVNRLKLSLPFNLDDNGGSGSSGADGRREDASDDLTDSDVNDNANSPSKLEKSKQDALYRAELDRRLFGGQLYSKETTILQIRGSHSHSHQPVSTLSPSRVNHSRSFRNENDNGSSDVLTDSEWNIVNNRSLNGHDHEQQKKIPLQPQKNYCHNRSFYKKCNSNERWESNIRQLFSHNKDRLMNQSSYHSSDVNTNGMRAIPQQPERILDAPGLIDDYYLNLLDWNHTTNILAVALSDTVYLWNASTGQINKLMTCGGGSDTGAENTTNHHHVTSVAWIEDGSYLAIGTNYCNVQLWDIERMKRVRVLDCSRGMDGRRTHTASRIGALSWNTQTQYMLTSGSRSGQIVNHDVRILNHLMSEWTSHTQEVCGLKWSTDGTQLASGGNDNVLNIWDLNHPLSMNPTIVGYGSPWNEPRYSMNHHSAAVKALAWCPWSPHLLASGGGTQDRHLRFWNTQTGEQLQSVDTKSQVCSIIWSKHDRELVSSHGFSQNQLIVWKYPKLRKMAELTGHQSRVLHMAQSPDGTTIVSGAGDETLRFWNIFNAPTPSNDLLDCSPALMSMSSMNIR